MRKESFNVLWLFVWFLLSAFVLGAFAWTTRILFAQKKEWAAFAARHKLKYEKGPLLGSPKVQGTFKGYQIGIFSEPQRTPDARGVRFRTAVEISAHVSMPTVGAVGIGDISALLGPLEMQQSYTPNSQYWDERFFLKSHDSLFLESFLTEERLKPLSEFLKMRCDTAILLFDRQNMLLRLETADPYADAKRLGGLLGKMMATANAVFPKEQGAQQEPEPSPPATE